MPTFTAFQSGVGPSACSSVRRMLQQLVMVRGEVARIDLDAVREAADPGPVVRRIISTNVSAAFCTSPKFPRMLPLRSSSITTVIGCRSFENSVMS